MQNLLLKHMDKHDLDRRYSSTYVRYRNRIVYVNNFELGLDKPYINFTDAKGRYSEIFDGDSIDISRPKPCWVLAGRQNPKAYYVNYKFERQWSRGFCQKNSIIRTAGNNMNLLPKMICLSILEAFYKPRPKNKVSYTLVDVKENLEESSFCLLSPDVLVQRQPIQGRTVVYYKEADIGDFGKIDPLFVQELKELVKDYNNDENLEFADRNAAQKVQHKNPKGKRNQIAFGDLEGVGDFGFDRPQLAPLAADF